MTPRQIENTRKKIADVKRMLAAEKRKFGGYDDSGGARYLPLRWYVQLEDYRGGLAYARWFAKTFPDDIGYPDFLFEWLLILFKTGKLKEVEKKAFQVFCSNTYLFDRFFGWPVIQVNKWEGSNLESPAYVQVFHYFHLQRGFLEFSAWLTKYVQSEKFILLSGKYIDIHKRLLEERDTEARRNLISQARELSGAG